MQRRAAWAVAALTWLVVGLSADAQIDRVELSGLVPVEIRKDGWRYVVHDVAAGRADYTVQWPSCGRDLDRHARQSTVVLDSLLGFGRDARGVHARGQSQSGVTCLELVVPQAACTVKVFVAMSVVYHEMAARLVAGTSAFEPGRQFSDFAMARAPANTSGATTCYLQFRNWGDARRIVVAWPPPAA